MDLGKAILDVPLRSSVFYGVGIHSMTSKILNYRTEFVPLGTAVEQRSWKQRIRMPFLQHFET
jgi:hypothetical protein